jgi:hypothetical protein
MSSGDHARVGVNGYFELVKARLRGISDVHERAGGGA